MMATELPKALRVFEQQLCQQCAGALHKGESGEGHECLKGKHAMLSSPFLHAIIAQY